MILRLARPDDRAAAVEVWRASRAAHGRRPNATLLAQVEQAVTEGLVVVAEDDGEVVGVALGEPQEEDLLLVRLVVVRPEHRGQGLGSGLVEALADAAWERGMRRAEARCAEPAFLEACGFERADGPPEDGPVRLTAELEAPVRDVVVQGEIRLGQFLKLAELVESGSEAKARIAAGEVSVDDEVETRRGRQLVDGDVVRTAEGAARVRLG